MNFPLGSLLERLWSGNGQVHTLPERFPFMRKLSDASSGSLSFPLSEIYSTTTIWHRVSSLPTPGELFLAPLPYGICVAIGISLSRNSFIFSRRSTTRMAGYISSPRPVKELSRVFPLPTKVGRKGSFLLGERDGNHSHGRGLLRATLE